MLVCWKDPCKDTIFSVIASIFPSLFLRVPACFGSGGDDAERRPSECAWRGAWQLLETGCIAKGYLSADEKTPFARRFVSFCGLKGYLLQDGLQVIGCQADSNGEVAGRGGEVDRHKASPSGTGFALLCGCGTGAYSLFSASMALIFWRTSSASSLSFCTFRFISSMRLLPFLLAALRKPRLLS